MKVEKRIKKTKQGQRAKKGIISSLAKEGDWGKIGGKVIVGKNL